eukprot:gene7586-15547_t
MVCTRFLVFVIISASSVARHSVPSTKNSNSSTFSSSFESNLSNEPKQLENVGDMSLGFGPLILSIVFCPTFVVEYLLNNGVSIQTINVNGYILSPILKFLIENGADINSKDDRGRSELFRACVISDKEAVKLLINAGADVNAKTNNGISALNLSIFGNDVSPDLMDLLVKGGADVNERTKNGYNLLHMAVYDGNSYAIDKLLQSGADINAVDDRGRSVLHYLFFSKVGEYTTTSTPGVFVSFLRNLLDKGAKIFGDDEGRSPLDPVYMEHFDSNIMKLLIDRSENNKEYRDRKGRSLLFRWASTRNLKAVKLLIDNGADINAVTGTRECCLIFPILNNDLALLELYLQYEYSDIDMAISMIHALMEGFYASADMIFQKCSTLARQEALAQLVYRHVSNTPSLDLIRRLLVMGADPNLTGIMPIGHPLMSPALSNKTELVRLLLEFGADPDKVGVEQPNYEKMFPNFQPHKLDNLTPEELTVRVVVDAVGLHDIIALFDENHDNVVASRAPLDVRTADPDGGATVREQSNHVVD